ncbi:hypothetical protein GCM10023310_43100 [Paenibacillus vulneris]|uniref:Phosphatidylinositol-specific phospholipase C/glycerophosphodiester phosphodiesterase family protein n=1 Tax=Paenibacillus vulneris TaxID=1133364 RepID=A0ABW3UTX0_9BACL
MRHLTILLFLSLVFFWGGTSYAENSSESPFPEWTKNKLIAHAFGSGVSGESYTNSYESFVINYAMGQRVFEVDLSLTSDNNLVARHDWSTFFNEYLQQKAPEGHGENPWSKEEFMSQKIMNKYTPMDITRIMELMRQFPDMYIVTDTKETQSNLVRQQFQIIVSAANHDPELLNRVIPQIYNQGMLDDIKSIYDFHNIIYTLYMSPDTNEQVIEFVKKQNIKVITLPIQRADSKFLKDLKDNGVLSYVHTINSLRDLKNHEMNGVYGFYTDAITPRLLQYEQSASKVLNDLLQGFHINN